MPKNNSASPLQRLRKTLESNIVLLDGPMGTMIQAYDLQEADYRGDKYNEWPQDLKGNNDLLNITKPEVIEEIHSQFIEAGARIIETNTFNSNEPSLSDYSMGDMVYEINYAGAKIARKIADKYIAQNNYDIFVAGAIGPTNRTCSLSPDVEDPSCRNINYDQLVDTYSDATRALIDGGADIILIETIFDTLNAKAALFAVEEVAIERDIKIPIMVSGTITDASGRTLSGQTTEAFWHSVKHANLLSVGLNCALGAAELRPFLKNLSDIADCYLSVYPNCLLYTSPSPRDRTRSRMPSSA